MRKSWRLGLALLGGLIVVAAILLPTISAANRSIIDVVTNPIVVTVGGAVITFLAFDRWRALENEVSNLRNAQLETLNKIRESAESSVRTQLEDVTRQANVIQGRISSLVDEHPWISEISELEIVPDSKMCRLIVAAAEEMLATGRGLLCYQYLSAVLGRESDMVLEGVADDFRELAAFCELVLGDHYMAYQALRAATRSPTASTAIAAATLRLAVRYGDRTAAAAFARQIRPIVQQHWATRFLPFLAPHNNVPASLLRDSLLALALYEGTYGEPTAAERYIRRYAKDDDKGTPWQVAVRLELAGVIPGAPMADVLLPADLDGLPLADLAEVRLAHALLGDRAAAGNVDTVIGERVHERVTRFQAVKQAAAKIKHPDAVDLNIDRASAVDSADRARPNSPRRGDQATDLDGPIPGQTRL